ATMLLVLFGLFTAFRVRAQTTYSNDFQQLSIQTAVPGWTDSTAVGQAIEGVFRTWPDPLRNANTVYGVRQMRRRAIVPQPAVASARFGTFSTYTSQIFAAAERLEYRGRFLRTNAETQFGLTFFSGQPEADRYYIIAALPASMQLSHVGAGQLAGITDSAFVPEANRWYQFLIEAEESNGTTLIRARFWDDGAPEPQAFSIIAGDALHVLTAHTADGDVTLKILIDTTPPELTIFTLAANACTNAADIQVSGRVFDLTLAVVKVAIGSGQSVNAKVADDGTFAVTIAAPAEGKSEIVIEADDHLDHVSVARSPITIDRTRPGIDITSNGATFAR